MLKHVKNYLNEFGYDQSDFIPCEACGNKSVDIHHVEPRSKFGGKLKDDRDHPNNLVALCRSCHDEAHGYQSRIIKNVLKKIIQKRQS